MGSFPLLSNPQRGLDAIPRLAAPEGLTLSIEPPATRAVGPAFGEVLTSFLQQTDAAQHKADGMVESLALGEPVDVHQVMLALNEAGNAVHLALQVRGKLLEAYQEFMRMPI